MGMWRAGCGANSHVRFGGRARETDRLEGRHRALVRPYARAVVFSFDEKTQCQALDRTQPSLPMKPGRAGTMTHDYKRNGTIDLFAAMNIATGQVLTDLHKGHTGTDVLRFFKHIDASVPRGLGVHVILDNLSAHWTPEITKWLATRTAGVGTCTSLRPPVPGSTSSNDGSRNSPINAYAAASSPASRT